jgi:hypothetical protein
MLYNPCYQRLCAISYTNPPYLTNEPCMCVHPRQWTVCAMRVCVCVCACAWCVCVYARAYARAYAHEPSKICPWHSRPQKLSTELSTIVPDSPTPVNIWRVAWLIHSYPQVFIKLSTCLYRRHGGNPPRCINIYPSTFLCHFWNGLLW